MVTELNSGLPPAAAGAGLGWLPLLPAVAAAARAAIFPDTWGPRRALLATELAEPTRGLSLATELPAVAAAGMKRAAAAAAAAVPPKLGAITPAAAAAAAGLVWKPGGVRRLAEEAAEWVGLSCRSERAWEGTLLGRGTGSCTTVTAAAPISALEFVICSAGVPSASWARALLKTRASARGVRAAQCGGGCFC